MLLQKKTPIFNIQGKEKGISIPSLSYTDSVEVFRIYVLHATTSLYCQIKLMETCARWRTWRWEWGGWSWRWRASPRCTWEARRGPARRSPGRQRRSGRSRKSCKRSHLWRICHALHIPSSGGARALASPRDFLLHGFTSDHPCIKSTQCTLNTWVFWNESCATRNREYSRVLECHH